MKTRSLRGRSTRFGRRMIVLKCVAVLIGTSQITLPGSALAQHNYGNGLALGMRHDILQRNDRYRHNPSELQYGVIGFGTYDAYSPYQGAWVWFLTDPGQLPINNRDPHPAFPPGLVYGLHANPDHLVNWHPQLAEFFRWPASNVLDKGYLSCHAQDHGRANGQGLNWLVTTEEPWVAPYPWGKWYRILIDIYTMPTGTMVGLIHTKYGNQETGPEFIPTWNIMINQNLYPLHLDPRPSYTRLMPGFATMAVMYVLGFDVKYGGDAGLGDEEGFYWYEKVAQPFARFWG